MNADPSGISKLSQYIKVNFDVRQLDQARVLWLNERWLLKTGLDITRLDIRKELVSELLSRFGVRSVGNIEGCEHAKGTLWADRYGAPAGTTHGGSGRCGFSGGFNAKGIGPTPLVPSGADPYYADGLMSLDEALRETIGAQIAGAELPFGAVPVLAIIQTGLVEARPDGSSEMTAIVVRPNFIRPAHFERSIFFGTAGTIGSDQYNDSLRVKDAVNAAVTVPSLSMMSSNQLYAMFDRFAAQIASARAYRLWQGRFLSSNVAICGALVDFGSFRAVADWCRSFGLPGEEFGGEAAHMAAISDSLCFNLERHPSFVNSSKLPRTKAEFNLMIDNHFVTASLAALRVNLNHPSRAAANLAHALISYFREQQKLGVVAEIDHLKVNSSIFKDYRTYTHHEFDAAGGRVFNTIQKVISDSAYKTSALDATRWLMPRADLAYSALRHSTGRIASKLSQNRESDAMLVSHFINGTLGRSRRIWPSICEGLDILGQAVEDNFAVLTCVDKVTREEKTVIECEKLGGDYIVGPLRVSHSALFKYDHDTNSTTALLVFPANGNRPDGVSPELFELIKWMRLNLQFRYDTAC